MQSLKTTFADKKKTRKAKFYEKRQNLDSYSTDGKQNLKQSKMSNRRCLKARLQYLQHSYKASEATSWATCFALL